MQAEHISKILLMQLLRHLLASAFILNPSDVIPSSSVVPNAFHIPNSSDMILFSVVPNPFHIPNPSDVVCISSHPYPVPKPSGALPISSGLPHPFLILNPSDVVPISSSLPHLHIASSALSIHSSSSPHRMLWWVLFGVLEVSWEVTHLCLAAGMTAGQQSAQAALARVGMGGGLGRPCGISFICFISMISAHAKRLVRGWANRAACCLLPLKLPLCPFPCPSSSPSLGCGQGEDFRLAGAEGGKIWWCLGTTLGEGEKSLGLEQGLESRRQLFCPCLWYVNVSSALPRG